MDELSHNRRSTAPRRTQTQNASHDRLRRAIFPHVFVMARHDIDAALNRCGNIAEELLDLRVTLDLYERIVAFRHDSLANENLDPALLAEQLVVLAEDPAVRAPQIDLILKRGRQLHRAAIFPQITVALVRPIVKRDEVAYALPFEIALAIELVDGRFVRRRVREQPYQPDR